MEWESKVKMVQLGNAMSSNGDGRLDFQNYVLLQMSNFDIQAWDMFCNIIEIIVADMKADIEFWRGVYGHIKNVDCNNPSLGFRSGMRIAMIQTICEEELMFVDNQ